MFQTLQPNQTLYILNKSGIPTIEKATVQTQPALRAIPAQQYGQMPTQVVDVTVMFPDGQTSNYTLPANSVVGTLQGNSSMVVAMSREAISNELLVHRQKSVEHLNANEFHQNVISRCDELWQELNPEAREKEQQKNEFNALKSEVGTLTSLVQQMLAQQQQILSIQQGSERTSKSTKSKENA